MKNNLYRIGCFFIVLALAYLGPRAAAEGTPKDKTARALSRLEAAGRTFQARFSLTPVAAGRTDASPGLRSLTLYADPDERLEPDGVWPNGRPVSAAARIDEEEARRILKALAKDGFFKTATKYHSVRSQAGPAKFPPPADSKEYSPAPGHGRYCRLTLIASDEHWHTYYEGDWDWGPAMFSRLDSLRKALKGEAGKAMAELIAAAKEKH